MPLEVQGQGQCGPVKRITVLTGLRRDCKKRATLFYTVLPLWGGRTNLLWGRRCKKKKKPVPVTIQKDWWSFSTPGGVPRLRESRVHRPNVLHSPQRPSEGAGTCPGTARLTGRDIRVRSPGHESVCAALLKSEPTFLMVLSDSECFSFGRGPVPHMGS